MLITQHFSIRRVVTHFIRKHHFFPEYNQLLLPDCVLNNQPDVVLHLKVS